MFEDIVWDVYQDGPHRTAHYRGTLDLRESGIVVLHNVTGDVVADMVILSPHTGPLRISQREPLRSVA